MYKLRASSAAGGYIFQGDLIQTLVDFTVFEPRPSKSSDSNLFPLEFLIPALSHLS
jgi:hypothetical protein